MLRRRESKANPIVSGLVAVLLALIGLFGMASRSVAQSASIQYGSIGSGSSLFGSTSTGAENIMLDFQGTGGTATGTVGIASPVYTASLPSTADSSLSGSPLFAQNSTATPATVTIPSPASPMLPATTSTFIQPLDPYSVPAQSSLFGTGTVSAGQSSYNTGYSDPASKVYSGDIDRFVPETYEAMRRFRESTSVDFTYLPGGKKSDSFGLSEFDIRMQLAVPCRFIPNNGAGHSGPGYFYIAPGANFVWWNGPVGPPHVSPNGFGAFIDIGSQPQFSDNLALDVWFRTGIYSDYKNVTSKAFRFQGRVMGLFHVAPHLKLALGVTYLDRARVKLLPTGGVVWTPKDDWIFRLTFPNPKISKKVWHGGRAEWWAYVAGDYGGGSWDIDGLGKTDYNDMRVGIGIEFETLTRINGYFEFGGSFGRELYNGTMKRYKLPDVVYLKTGFVF